MLTRWLALAMGHERRGVMGALLLTTNERGQRWVCPRCGWRSLPRCGQLRNCYGSKGPSPAVRRLLLGHTEPPGRDKPREEDRGAKADAPPGHRLSSVGGWSAPAVARRVGKAAVCSVAPSGLSSVCVPCAAPGCRLVSICAFYEPGEGPRCGRAPVLVLTRDPCGASLRLGG